VPVVCCSKASHETWLWASSSIACLSSSRKILDDSREASSPNSRKSSGFWRDIPPCGGDSRKFLGGEHSAFVTGVPYCGLESYGGSIFGSMTTEFAPLKLTSPRIFLLRMLVFVMLCALTASLLHKQIEVAFMANPALNSLIILVLAIGIALALRQALRLYPEINWVNGFRLADRRTGTARPPILLAPMAAILGSRAGRVSISAQMMQGILDSIANRLDEARDISRYLTGLLVFLGLLGTFWGLIETITSVGAVIQGLKATGDAGSMFESLREGLAAPLGGMGISFSSSLFGLAGSLVLGFLDLQASQAQNRFYTELEDWLSTTVYDQTTPAIGVGASGVEMRNAIERLRAAVKEAGDSRASSAAMSDLAEAVQELVGNMRIEQQMIRDWVESQGENQRDVKRLLEYMTHEKINR
jgi:hypothetical protein